MRRRRPDALAETGNATAARCRSASRSYLSAVEVKVQGLTLNEGQEVGQEP